LFISASLQHPFPAFGVKLPTAFADVFSQIAEQVAADHPSIGVHVWNLSSTLNRSLTTDWLHPTVQGHAMVGAVLAGLLRPIVANTSDRDATIQ
jgi:hypothetical protein